MRYTLIALVLCACRGDGPPSSAPAAGSAAGSAPTEPKRVTHPDSTEGAASVAYTIDGRDVRATHALADIGPNEMTIFISSAPLTCKSVHGDMAADRIELLLPIGAARDYYAGKAVGIPVWASGTLGTATLAPAFATVAIDKVDAKSARIAGDVRFAGRAHLIGKTATQQLAGSGRFEAGICDLFGTLADPPARPVVHLDVPFAGVVAHKPFTAARAFAIVCGDKGNRFVARLELNAEPGATCHSFWDGAHVELDTIGGAAERAPVLGEAQPAGSMVGDSMGGDSRSGTASVTWKHLGFDVGATVTGSAQVDALGDKAEDGTPWTDASGTFEATVCADAFDICRVSGG